MDFSIFVRSNSIFPLVAKLDIAADSDSEGRGFESLRAGQKRTNFCLPKVRSFFIQAAGLAYHRRTKCGAYHQPLWGCISSRASVYFSCGLMRCNTAC